MRPAAAFTRRLRRLVRAHRRGVAAVLVFLAVLCAVTAARPDAPPTDAVLVAARDLASGSTLGAGDVEVRRLPPSAVPSRAYADASAVTGRTVAAPVRAGAPLTDWSLVQQDALEGYPPGTVLASVRVSDPAALAALRVGDRVHVLSSDPEGEAEPRVLTRSAPVAVLPEAGREGWSSDGGVVVLALPEEVALQVSDAASRDRLDVVVGDDRPSDVVG
ncbi:SAF domain-containing protein [Solicola sp. PLA-1-18]|uniref:SAF domain-containing protein n=1 Tax=Solicola sp. PLA-1-18 TaxID=3380532 RepID=UPI003B7E8095